MSCVAKRDEEVKKAAIEVLFEEHAVEKGVDWSGLKNVLNIFPNDGNSSKHLSYSLITMIIKKGC